MPKSKKKPAVKGSRAVSPPKSRAVAVNATSADELQRQRESAAAALRVGGRARVIAGAFKGDEGSVSAIVGGYVTLRTPDASRQFDAFKLAAV